MNVCDAILEILADYGVRYIFGIPGDAINELTEAIRKQEKIRFIHVMHEEAGAFAAAAQAKLTGELAACVGTAGPGAIHLLNGLYDAKLDQAPVIAITGQVETALQGTTYMQEVKLTSLFEDVTVYNEEIVNEHQVPEVLSLACQTALARRGVAHINLPSDISVRKVTKPGNRQIISSGVRIAPHRDDLLAASALINKSRKPCILAGIGARGAREELIAFATAIHAPVIKALRGKDLMDDDHPLTMGGIGLLGTEPAMYAVKHCDLFITVGSDFPYQDFYPADVPTIQIDDKIEQIGRRQLVTVALPGDARSTLAALLQLSVPSAGDEFLKTCQARMAKWRTSQEETESSNDFPIHPQRLARAVSQLANDDAVICCDTGAVTVWGARNFRIREGQRFTLSGHLASMAFGLPAALGAQLLFPGRQVIALCGDGGFAMLMADFATAVKYRLPVKIFVFNNGKLGLIQMEQEAHSGNPEFQTGLHNPDYAEFARICGGKGYEVRDAASLDATIEDALRSDAPCIVNVFVNSDELTMPPSVSATEAFNYGKAKIKEFFARHEPNND